jgi:hypothetical protein
MHTHAYWQLWVTKIGAKCKKSNFVNSLTAKLIDNGMMQSQRQPITEKQTTLRNTKSNYIKSKKH